MTPGFDPNCSTCGGDGYLDVYTEHLHQSYAAPCPECRVVPIAIGPAYLDEEPDGWLDDVHRVPAKYAGGELPLESITTIVMHRLSRGSGRAGPDYVSNPTTIDKAGVTRARYVSWHFTVHKGDWQRPLTQHVPICRVAWHAAPLNGYSLGIEHDGPYRGPWDDATIETSVALVHSLLDLCPSITRLVSHRSICPDRRKDPGPDFPWSAFSGLHLDITP